MVGFFAVAAALEEEEQRLVPCGDAGAENGFDAGTDVTPDLPPDFPSRLAKRPGVLLAERHLRVGVVVEEGQLRTPAHPHRKTRSEQDADDGAQALGPGFDRTERRGGPVHLRHECTTFATGGEGVAR